MLNVNFGRATCFHPARAPRFRRLLATLQPSEIGDAIEALIARLDALGGDPDLDASVEDDPRGIDPEEDDDRCDDELSGDEQDYSTPEWEPALA